MPILGKTQKKEDPSHSLPFFNLLRLQNKSKQ